MRETNREQIRRALDECLSGMDGRPSLEKRVLARAKGERHGPRRLSLALAVALLMLLLAAAALLGISDPLLARLLAGACAYAALAGAALTAVGVRRGNLKADLSVRMRRKGAEA